MGIRFEENFTGEQGSYKVIIYDSTYPSDSPSTMQLTSDGCIVKEEGDPYDPLEIIHTATLTLKMYLNSPETELFKTDLTSFEGDRFYVEVKTGPGYSETAFAGKLLVNDVEVQDAYEPVLSVKCIDGVADLKFKEYDYTSLFNNLMPLRELIQSILIQIPTLELYDSTDVIATVYSNVLAEDLANEDPTTTNDKQLYRSGSLYDYFYKEDGGKQKRLTYYEVLEEVCRRFFLTLRYRHGKYEFIGVETLHDTIETTALNILKDGTYSNGTTLKVADIDISDKLFAGGSFKWKEGYKKIFYRLPDTEISNGKLTDYSDWENRVIEYYVGNQRLFEEPYEDDGPFFNGDGFEQVFAENLENGVPYFLRTYLEIRNTWFEPVPDVDYVRFRFTIYETPIGGVKTQLEQFTKDYYLGSGTYQIQTEIDDVAYDRNLSIKVEFIDYSGTVIWLRARWFSFLKFRSDDGTEINHLATVNTTAFKLEKGFDLLKPQAGPEILSNLMLWNIDRTYDNNQAALRPRVIQTFKINSTATAMSWEEMTLRRMMSILRASIKVYNISFKSYVLNRIGRLVVNGEGNFVIGSISYDFRKGINSAQLIEMKSLDETNIDYIESDAWVLETDEVDISGLNSGGEVKSLTAPKFFPFDNHSSNEAVLTDVDPNYEIPNTATQESVVKSFRVLVNGRELRQVYTTVDMPRDTYVVDKQNNKVIFHDTLRNARVEIWVTDFFVITNNPVI